MNRLVALLRGNPEVAVKAAERESASFEWLADAFGDALLRHQERDVLVGDERLGRALADSYLPVITADEWNRGTVLAGARPPVEAEWWVTMVPAGGTGRGLTAPEDATDTELISLFSGPPTNVRPVVFDPARRRLIPVAAAAHCLPPIRGVCGSGLCGGCKERRVYEPRQGGDARLCRCDDPE
jgi:hypothetical protein